jgi:hypothetical protein
MTRNGRIARLPQSVREQVNRRLDNGEQGKQIAEWLNTLPEVKTLIDAQFAGQPISEVNLSNWKLGGYIDWQAQQDALAAASQLAEDAAQLDEAGGQQITEQLALCLAARLAAALRQLNTLGDDPEAQLKLLRELCMRLSALRKGDHNAQLLELKREKLDLDWKKFKSEDSIRKLERLELKEKVKPYKQITKEGLEQIEDELRL